MNGAATKNNELMPMDTELKEPGMVIQMVMLCL